MVEERESKDWLAQVFVIILVILCVCACMCSCIATYTYAPLEAEDQLCVSSSINLHCIYRHNLSSLILKLNGWLDWLVVDQVRSFLSPPPGNGV